MDLTKQQAFKALAQKIRSRHNLSINKAMLLSELRVKEDLATAKDPYYRRFLEAYEGKTLARGGHPDYDYLAQPNNIGQTEDGEITTFFLDLRNFTKYCLFLPRENVYAAKSATIEAVIGVCHVYDGHLHEVPGDGVLFFFGGRNQDQLACASQALRAACDAMSLLEEDIIPEYNDDDKYPSIYPKIGVDYGQALWGAYGADACYEVKATAFNVDIAAKMMSQCRAREVALGDSLKEFKALDEAYLTSGWVYKRTLTIAGEEKHIEYPTWLFDWRRFKKDTMAQDDADLSQLGISWPLPAVAKSRTQLRPAPLA